jgi:prepilin-type N-terminal cleavage/methylation domain-containing protein
MGTLIHSKGRLRNQALSARSSGYSLIELLLVVAVLGICLAVGSVSLVDGLSTQEARGAAQSWQAAATWAQIGVLWHGGATEVEYATGLLALAHDPGVCGGDLGPSAPAVPVRANLARWRESEGVKVSFTGAFASPDGGGSLFFDTWRGSYRVVVRPESGLTTRTRVEVGP